MRIEIFITTKNWEKMVKAYNKKFHAKEDIDKSIVFHASYTDGFVYPTINMIGLNLKRIQESSTLLNEDFYDYICNTISHEVIHLWLDDNINIKASDKLDNIAKKYKDYGMW
jgi:hypothetical protein